METELRSIHDSRKSFYKKAYVIEEDGIKSLRSYETIVAKIENDNLTVFGSYSVTTLRHIKEFMQQNGFKHCSKDEILKDYSPKEEEEKPFNMLKMVCAFGDVLNNNQKEKNDFKLRMFKASMENKGLNIPEDWDTLSEEEKEKRLNGALKVI